MGNNANAHVARVDIQTVRDVSNEQYGVFVPIPNVARNIQDEHHVHLLTQTCMPQRTSCREHHAELFTTRKNTGRCGLSTAYFTEINEYMNEQSTISNKKI